MSSLRRNCVNIHFAATRVGSPTHSSTASWLKVLKNGKCVVVIQYQDPMTKQRGNLRVVQAGAECVQYIHSFCERILKGCGRSFDVCDMCNWKVWLLYPSIPRSRGY